MKPEKHQETPTTKEETPSNNKDTNKNDSEIECPKAGLPKLHESWFFPEREYFHKYIKSHA